MTRMASSGKTLMQIENEKRRNFTRVISMIAGLPVIGVGISLLYFGYSETDYLYLFLYFALGLVLTLFGFMLLVSGRPIKTPKITIGRTDEPVRKFKAPPDKCPYCDTDIVSAGKFCGSCGQELTSQ